MESNTKHEEGLKDGIAGETRRDLEWLEQDWEKVEERLGIDLEKTAREAKAIQRLREIRKARDLLRLILCYALSDWSFRMLGVWAFLRGIGSLSDVAILNRMRKSRVWLGMLIGKILEMRCTTLKSLPGVRLRIMDATCVSGPGSHTTDWRVHLCFDLGNLCLDGIELTDRHGGENLVRFTPDENEIRLVDGAYSFASGMGPGLALGAGLVVRINWRNVPVYRPDGQRFEIIPWLRSLQGPSQCTIDYSTPQGCFLLRLIAAPLPPKKAAEARRRARLKNQRKQLRHQPTEETLFACGFVILLTNLSSQAWPLDRVLTLYRSRWQIELLIKRLKSLIHLDQIRAKDPQLAQTYLLAKLLVALIVDEFNQRVQWSQPDWPLSLDRPLSIYRLTHFHLEAFRQLVYGHWFFPSLYQHFSLLKRNFCDTPRSRKQQLAWVRALFEHLYVSSHAP